MKVPTLDIFPEDLKELANGLQSKNHQATLDGVKIDYVFSYAKRDKNGELSGANLKYANQEADYKVVIVKPENRITGGPDVIVHIDGDKWVDWNDMERLAVIDEALERIEPVFTDEDENGNVTTAVDDFGRPKLRKREYDMVAIGFRSIAERHGVNSPFVRRAEGFCKEFGSIIPYGDNDAAEGNSVLGDGDDQESS